MKINSCDSVFLLSAKVFAQQAILFSLLRVKGHFIQLSTDVVFLLLSIFLLTSCEGDLLNECLSGRGNTTTERRGLYPFRNIAVYDNIQLTIEQSNEFSVTITSGHKLIPLISNLITSNTLEIRNESPCALLKDPWKPVDVLVKVPVIDSLFLLTQAKVSVIGAITGDHLYVEASETSADIDMNLNTRYFRLDFLSGTADINISGYSDTIFIYNVAAGKVDALKSQSQVMIVNTGSMNDVYVSAGKRLLDVNIRNIGNVFYSNNPQEIIYYTTDAGKLLRLY